MITLKKIKLNNFLSHRESEVVFSPNQKLLIDGVSGSGKSSVVEGLIWAFYGKARSDNRNVVRRGAKEASVVVEIEDDGTIYRIERKCDTVGKHSLSVGEKKGKAFSPVKKTGLRDTQIWLEKTILRSSYTLFVNSVAYPQDSVENFVKQTASKRKEMLLEIASVEDFDEYYDKAKKALDRDNKDEFELSCSLSSMENEMAFFQKTAADMENLETEKKRIQKDIDRISAEIEKNQAESNYISNLEAQISSNDLQLLSIKSRIIEQTGYISKKEDSIKSIPEIDFKEIENGKKELESVRAGLIKLKKEIDADYELTLRRNAAMMNKPADVDYTSQEMRLNNQLLEIQMSVDTHCEHLGRPCPRLEAELSNRTAFVSSQLADLKERKEKHEKALNAYSEELLAIPQSTLSVEDKNRYNELLEREKGLTKYEHIGETASANDNLKKSLQKDIDEASEMSKKLNYDFGLLVLENINLKKELDELTKDGKNDVKELKITLSSMTDSLSWTEAKLINAKKSDDTIKEMVPKIDLIKAKLLSTKARVEELSLIKEAFGSKGIRNIVIDYLIPRLEYRINDILTKMSDFKIRLETQKEKNSDDGIKEGLFINIYNGQGEQFSYENYSGSEKLKVSYSIFQGLASLQKCNFHIIDEMVAGLDPENESRFVELILDLKEKSNKQLICISHIRSVKDVFDETILIEKKNGASCVACNH